MFNKNSSAKYIDNFFVIIYNLRRLCNYILNNKIYKEFSEKIERKYLFHLYFNENLYSFLT